MRIANSLPGIITGLFIGGVMLCGTAQASVSSYAKVDGIPGAAASTPLPDAPKKEKKREVRPVRPATPKSLRPNSTR